MNAYTTPLAKILDNFCEFNPDKTIPIHVAEFAKNCNPEHVFEWPEYCPNRPDKKKAREFITELVNGYYDKEFDEERIIYELKLLFNIKSSIYKVQYQYFIPKYEIMNSKPIREFQNNDKPDEYFNNKIKFTYHNHFIIVRFNTDEILGRK